MANYKITLRFKIIVSLFLFLILIGSFFIIRNIVFSKFFAQPPVVRADAVKTIVHNSPNFKDPEREYYKAEIKYAHHNNYTKPVAEISQPATPTTVTASNTQVPPKNIKMKTAFLTFDDGPSLEVTPKIIEILSRYKIKATFFLIGTEIEKHPDLVAMEVSQGFAIANHTYTHDPKFDYDNPNNLVSDFNKNELVLKKYIPGYHSKIVRFPGGSKMRPRPFINAVKNAGYTFVDWNSMTRDAENPKYTVNDLFNNYKKTMHNDDSLVILMHDSEGKQNTALVLPKVIDDLQSKGYVFDTLK